ncbi:hypothetical protein TNCV_3499382 [Trichonephila clavipes]|nr:hypothetical protein TNCV_3499382 [Trichonephila clavipes]
MNSSVELRHCKACEMQVYLALVFLRCVQYQIDSPDFAQITELRSRPESKGAAEFDRQIQRGDGRQHGNDKST